VAAVLQAWLGTALRISNPLGRWYADAEMLTKCCCYLYEKRLIVESKGGFYEFLPFTERARTRFSINAHQFHDVDLLSKAKVVDITRKNDSIYVLAQCDQNNIIFSEQEPPVMSLQDLYNNLSPELQRIIETIAWPSDTQLIDIANSIQQGTGGDGGE